MPFPILEATIAARMGGQPFHGQTYREIETGFSTLGRKYLRSDFHPTYIQRRLGPSGFLESSGERYKLREDLLLGTNSLELAALVEELHASLRSAYQARQRLIAELEAQERLPKESIVERHRAVDSYLSQIGGNRGENFEVVSFALFQEYSRSLGFELRRLSTVHANDGGMDFVAGAAIYQVTVDESIEKMKRDLKKCPETKRVLIRPATPPGFSLDNEEDVLAVLELRDLLDRFLAWLLARDKRRQQSNHLQKVIRIALDEFKRENKAEGWS
jgi:hypothetical protein